MFHYRVKELARPSNGGILAVLGFEQKRYALGSALSASTIFVAGIVLGAGVALLNAPKSGRELRRSVKSTLTELAHLVGIAAAEPSGSKAPRRAA